MNKYLFDTVATIASETRHSISRRAKLSNFGYKDLTGWCAIASAELHKHLLIKGIKSVIHVHNDGFYGDHCFLVVDDHVVDITATQFREYKNVEVVIKHVKEAEVNEYHTTTKTFNTASDLRVYQKRSGWPSRQICC